MTSTVSHHFSALTSKARAALPAAVVAAFFVLPMLAACAKREEPEVAQKEAPEAAAEKAPEVAGGGSTLTVVDLSPLNWLSVTWMTMEELVRVDKDGHTVPTLASAWQWSDDKRGLTFNLRKGVTFQDGEKLDAHVFRRSFDEVQKWKSPHPPGAFLNFDPKTKLEVLDDYTVRFSFPEPDAGALMKFRGMHVGSTRFWDQGGFVNKKTGTAEGHW